MRPKLIAPPTELPVGLSELKAAVRVEHDFEDALLTTYLHAATGHLDGWQGVLGRCMVTQTWRVQYADGICGKVLLPFPDVQSAVARTQAGDEVDGTSLIEADAGSILDLAGGRATEIDLVAGFGGPESVPYPLKVAILMLASSWFENREAVGANSLAPVPMGVDLLISPYRWRRV